MAKQMESSVQTEKNKVVEVVANNYHLSDNNLTSGADKAFASPPSPPSPQLSHSNGSSGGEASNRIAIVSPPSPPIALLVGDRVEYVGIKETLQRQYAGILEIYEVGNDCYTCMKPDTRLTSWIEAADLRLVED